MAGTVSTGSHTRSCLTLSAPQQVGIFLSFCRLGNGRSENVGNSFKVTQLNNKWTVKLTFELTPKLLPLTLKLDPLIVLFLGDFEVGLPGVSGVRPLLMNLKHNSGY